MSVFLQMKTIKKQTKKKQIEGIDKYKLTIQEGSGEHIGIGDSVVKALEQIPSFIPKVKCVIFLSKGKEKGVKGVLFNKLAVKKIFLKGFYAKMFEKRIKLLTGIK